MNKSTSTVKIEDNQQIINGLMNGALRISANRTGYDYRDIIQLWINSMFPDMEVK